YVTIGSKKLEECREMRTPAYLPALRFRGTSQMDYHDLQMFYLEMVAEDRLNQAVLAKTNGDTAASKEVERWSITLEHIRGLKTALSRMQPMSVHSRIVGYFENCPVHCQARINAEPRPACGASKRNRDRRR